MKGLRVGLPLFVMLTLSTAAVGQPLRRAERRPHATVQSELDYLRLAKTPISVELTQVTIRQAYDGIAKKVGLSITYEGAVNGESRHDVSFKNVTLKEVLGKVGETFKLSYRADGPDKLAVIGATPKPS